MASATPQLFAGLKLWISVGVPQRQFLVAQAQEHGAEIVPLETQAHYKLVDHVRKFQPPDAISFSFVQASIRNGRLEDPAAYRVSVAARAERPVGSTTVAAQGGRRKFTEEEDQFLYDLVTPYRNAGGKWKGNEIYRQLERLRPEHTYQSWRDRYIKHVSLQNRSITAQAQNTNRTWTNSNEPEREPSPKRRRVEGPPSHTVDAVAGEGSQEATSPVQPASRIVVSPRPTIGEAAQKPAQKAADDGINLASDSTQPLHGFAREEVKSLYKAVPDILKCTAQNSQKGWRDLAEGSDHTLEAWLQLYETIVLPEFRRRKDLQDDQKFHEFIDSLGTVKAEENNGEPSGVRTSFNISRINPEENGQKVTSLSTAGGTTISTPEPATPVALRIDIKANQGRKRASQSQSQSTTTNSTLQASQSQSQSQPQPDQAASQDAPQPPVNAMPTSFPGNTATVHDSVLHEESIPADVPQATTGSVLRDLSDEQSQEIPESGQRPLQTITPTQSSGARITHDDSKMRSQSQTVLEADEVELLHSEDVEISLVEDWVLTNDGSDHDFSDTGSEYHAFDTAPERSQLWPDTAVARRSPSRSSGTDGNKTDDEDDVVSAARIIKTPKPPTPPRKQVSAQAKAQEDKSTDGESEADEERFETAPPEQHVAVASRLETQALFQQPLPDNLDDTMAFDLPEPAEGWEELGVDEGEIEDVDLMAEQKQQGLDILETTEREDHDVQAFSQTAAQFDEADDDESVRVLPRHRVAQTISSEGTREESETSEDEEEDGVVYQHQGSPPHSSEQTDPESGSDSHPMADRSVSPSFEDVLRGARRQNPHLSAAVLQRLTTTATEACTLDLRLAKAVLPRMIGRLQMQHERGPSRMSEEAAKLLLPENVRGCWTEQDDRDALSGRRQEGSRRGEIGQIRRAERKHGAEETAERVAFLALKYS